MTKSSHLTLFVFQLITEPLLLEQLIWANNSLLLQFELAQSKHNTDLLHNIFTRIQFCVSKISEPNVECWAKFWRRIERITNRSPLNRYLCFCYGDFPRVFFLLFWLSTTKVRRSFAKRAHAHPTNIGNFAVFLCFEKNKKISELSQFSNVQSFTSYSNNITQT